MAGIYSKEMEIQRLKSGSIDFSHYDRNAKALQSAAVYSWAKSLFVRKKNSCPTLRRVESSEVTGSVQAGSITIRFNGDASPIGSDRAIVDRYAGWLRSLWRRRIGRATCLNGPC